MESYSIYETNRTNYCQIALIEAISIGDKARAECILSEGHKGNEDIHKKNEEEQNKINVKSGDRYVTNASKHDDVHRYSLDHCEEFNINGCVNDMNALMVAASRDDNEMVDFLISKGADVNATDNNGSTALMKVLIEGGYNMANHLITKGASVNTKDYCGKTVLMLAALSGHKEVVQFLVSHGADVNTRDLKGKTALYYAKTDKIRKILIATGAIE